MRSATVARRKQYCEPISSEFKPPTLPETPLPGTEIVAFQLDVSREEVLTLKRTPGLNEQVGRYKSPRSFAMFQRWLKSYPVSVWTSLVAHYTGLKLGSEEEEATAWLVCDRRSDDWWLVDDATALAMVSHQRRPGSVGF